MIATAPLPDSVWSEIGLAERETFSDFRHLIIYGQRTADGRLAFGGRGAPYHFGSRIAPSFDRAPRVFAALQTTLAELFPVLRDVPITHRWGGPLGVTRDWHASVGLDRTTGIAWAGGYVGDGVSTTNLAGRTLSITNVATDPDSPPQILTFSLLSPPFGAAINPSNGLFTWRPAISQSGANLLNVVVSDNGTPSLSATQSFTVTISKPAPPQLAPTNSGGVFSLRIAGDAGPDYIIEAAGKLRTGTAWLPLATNLSATPPFLWTDPAAGTFAQRFYRVRLGP